MKSSLLMNFTVNKETNTLIVEREFAAPLHLVWQAWTDSKILDQWWAPKPWKAETKTQEFREGGSWLYAMVSPEGEKHWGKMTYETITPQSQFTGKDAFCDENGTPSPAMPEASWINKFSTSGDLTLVRIETTYEKMEDLEAVIKMGMKEGLTIAMEGLDAVLAAML